MTDTAVAAPETAAPTAAQKFSAEVLGTFVLVFFGVGAALATGGDVLTTGLAFGLTVLVMAYSVGRVTGGHFNPAVTVGAAVGGRLAWSHVPLYVVAQLLGAIAGAAVLWSVYQGIPGFSSEGSFGQNSFGDLSTYGLAWWAAFLVEAVTTLIFLMAILAVTDERNQHPALAPLAIGLTLAMIHFATIPLTGTSVNPARSIGPALFAGVDAIAQLWLFILAPLLGGGPRRPALPARVRPPRRAGRRVRPALRASHPARCGPRVRRTGRLPAAVEPAVRRPAAGSAGSARSGPLAAPASPAVAAAAVPHRPAPAVVAPAAAAAGTRSRQPPAGTPAVARERRRRPDPGTSADLTFCLAPLGCPAPAPGTGQGVVTEARTARSVPPTVVVSSTRPVPSAYARRTTTASGRSRVEVSSVSSSDPNVPAGRVRSSSRERTVDRSAAFGACWWR